MTIAMEIQDGNRTGFDGIRTGFTWKWVAEQIGADISGVRRYVTRLGATVSAPAEKSQLIEFLQTKTEPRGAWTPDKAAVAAKLLEKIQSESEPEAEKELETPKKPVELTGFDRDLIGNQTGFARETAGTTTEPAYQMVDISDLLKKRNWAQWAAVEVAPYLVSATSIGLTMYGLNKFWPVAGLFVGALLGLVILAAQIIARDVNLGSTSAFALKTVFFIELFAFGLHIFTFEHDFRAGQAASEATYWIRVGASTFVSAVFCLASYQSVRLVRQYFAEMRENAQAPTAKQPTK